MALVSAAMGGGDQGAKRVAGAKSNDENGYQKKQRGCKIHGASRALQADDNSAANIKRDASIPFLAIAMRVLCFRAQTRHGRPHSRGQFQGMDAERSGEQIFSPIVGALEMTKPPIKAALSKLNAERSGGCKAMASHPLRGHQTMTSGLA